MPFQPQIEIKAYINRQLSERHIRLQPHHLIKIIRKVFPNQSRSQVRAIIKTMISEGHLVYTNELSTTFLIRNRQADLQVAMPWKHNSKFSHVRQANQTVPIRLSDGVAFGYGNHPTTQLCLQGMKMVIQPYRKTIAGHGLTVLDIGTGSGVLAIAAALYGADKVIGIDTDTLACGEAKANAALNGVAEKISIIFGDVSAVNGKTFDVVLANLRVPTLKGLHEPILKLMAVGGSCLFSGFRRQESDTLKDLFRAPEWEQIWECHNRGWMAMAVKRPAGT